MASGCEYWVLRGECCMSARNTLGPLFSQALNPKIRIDFRRGLLYEVRR
jgi:hypothetical protein